VVCADVDADSATAATADVSRRADVHDLVQATASRHGRLDVMCNNAGILVVSPVLDLAEDQLDRVLAVNLKGVLFGCQEAGAVMRRQGSGSLVNMSSKELGPDGVRVNAIVPGLVESGIVRRRYTGADGAVDEGKRPAFLGGMAKISPLQLVGEPEDIGYAALYLASDGARWVTGQVLRPNGGVAMP
jgi:3-oxoacyl-[acyl-carrier protein] reductase